MIFTITILIIVISAFTIATYAQRSAPQLCITGIVLIAMLIPTFGQTPVMQITAAGGVLIISLIGLLRGSKNKNDTGSFPVNIALILYLVYSLANASLSISTQAAALRLAVTLGNVALVVLASRASSSSRMYLPALMATIVLTETALGTTELFFDQDAVWPRPDGSDRLENRVNHLAPWLAGRVLGSTSGPIPFGTIAAVGVITSLWMLETYGRRRYLPILLISIFGLLMSGTRSAALACAVVVINWLVTRATSSRPLIVLAASAGLTLLVLSNELLAFFGLDNSSETTSFTHRSEIISSISRLLFDQPITRVLLGHGDNARDLLSNGFLDVTTGVEVYDNQLVRELAANGIVGFVLLAIAIIWALRVGDGLSRIIIIFISAMFMSFDALTWNSIVVLFVIVASGPTGTSATLNKKNERTRLDHTSPLTQRKQSVTHISN